VRAPVPPLQRPARAQRSNVVPERLAELCKQIDDIKAKLTALQEVPPSVRRQAAEHGVEVLRAGGRIAHLCVPAQTQLAVRVLSVEKQGGLRIGLGAAGCGGLTDSNGCVAWDSAGSLVLGKIIRDNAMPSITAGHSMAVSLDHGGRLTFALNNEKVAHDPRAIWPQQPLEYFLCNEMKRTQAELKAYRASKYKDDCAWVSFRHASIEVLNGADLQDIFLKKVAAERSKLERQIAMLQARHKELLEQMRSGRERVLRMREQGSTSVPWVARIPCDLLLSAFMGVDADDVPTLMRVCSNWRQVVVERGLLERMQLCCFYTKASPSQDVLGFGISATYHPDGNLKELATELDVISSTAFTRFNLRRGAWGEDFEYFLPLVLDGSHVQRALPLLEESLAYLASGGMRVAVAGVQSQVPAFAP